MTWWCRRSKSWSKPLRVEFGDCSGGGNHGALGEIRTPNPHIRSVMLYPAELQALQVFGNGARGEIRTPGLLVRSQTLYPTELRAHMVQG